MLWCVHKLELSYITSIFTVSLFKNIFNYSTQRDCLLCGPAHVNSRCWGVRSFCDGEVHPDCTPVQLHAIGSLLRLKVNINYTCSPRGYFKYRCGRRVYLLLFLYLFGIICVLEIHKSKAPGAPRLLVIHNGNILQGAVFGEDVPQIPLCGVQAQAKDSQAAIRIWISLQIWKVSRFGCDHFLIKIIH